MNLFGRWLDNIADASAEDAEDVDAVVDRVARAVVGRGLSAPAVLFLEMNRPLSFLMSQGLHFATPLVGLFASGRKTARLAELLETPEGYDRLVNRIEELAVQAKSRRDQEPPGE